MDKILLKRFKNTLISEITVELATLKPNKIILFGSYAEGKQRQDSDIDIIVVTNDTFMPANYSELSNIYLEFSRKIRILKQKISIDLIVYTLPMYKKFLELDSIFSKEIKQKGIVLYENNNKTVA